MSDSTETRFRVTICDETIDFKGRIDSRADLDDLVARLHYAADFVWPQDGKHAASVSCETPAPPQREDGPITPVRLAEIVAEQLTDDEFARLTPRQSEAVALRRAGLTHSRVAVAMRLAGTSGVVHLINSARDRGVEVGERAPA
jgi:hypothetical protein